jgi:hypothetical protein
MGFDSMSGRMLAGDPAEMRKLVGIVPPRTVITIANRPQIEWWRGERLYVHRPIASQFLIHDVRVGVAATTASYGPIPADSFSTPFDRLAEIEMIFDKEGVIVLEIKKRGDELLGAPWPLPKARTATEVAFVIENISDEPARFLAGFLGEGPCRDY